MRVMPIEEPGDWLRLEAAEAWVRRVQRRLLVPFFVLVPVLLPDDLDEAARQREEAGLVDATTRRGVDHVRLGAGRTHVQHIGLGQPVGTLVDSHAQLFDERGIRASAEELGHVKVQPLAGVHIEAEAAIDLARFNENRFEFAIRCSHLVAIVLCRRVGVISLDAPSSLPLRVPLRHLCKLRRGLLWRHRLGAVLGEIGLLP